MSISTDARWARLAAAAASSMGASSPAITRAILAQWQCEHRNTWPPARNNPGNLARGFAAGVGIPYTVTFPNNPQPSNPIVTYATPEAGAAAYARGIATFARYRDTLAAARRGDGAAYLRAITTAGYGTRYACAISVYNAGAAAPAPGGSLPSPAPSSPGTATPALSLPGLELPDLGKIIGDALGRATVLLAITAGLLLGAWLLFREPAIQIAGTVAGARTGRL